MVEIISHHGHKAYIEAGAGQLGPNSQWQATKITGKVTRKFTDFVRDMFLIT